MTTKIFIGVASSKVFTNVISAESDDFWEFVGGQPTGYDNSYSASTTNVQSGFLTQDATPPNSFSADLRLRTVGTWIEDYSNQTIKIQFDAATSGSETIYGYIAENQVGGSGFGGNLYAEATPGSAQGLKQWTISLGDMTGSQLYLRVLSTSQEWVSARNIAVVLG